MELCLLCRACEAACPSGVPFGSLMTETRARIEAQTSRPFMERTARNFAFKHLFPHQGRLGLAFRYAVPLPGLGGAVACEEVSGVEAAPDPPVPHGVDASKAGPSARTPGGKAKSVPAKGAEKKTVALFSGCIMPLVFGPVNRATVNVLSRNGCRVDIPGGQNCCGALNVHSGERDSAREMARRNIDAFAEADTVVVNAAGCGAMLKEYEELLAEDPGYSGKAETFVAKVKDIHEFLADLPIVPPKSGFKKRVTYQDSCHLVHAQRIKEAPRKVLSSIPGVELCEMPNSDKCCGAAGVYNIVNPELSSQLLDSKMRDVSAAEADVVTTANPGCMLQLDMDCGSRDRGRVLTT